MNFFQAFASLLRSELTAKNYHIPSGWSDDNVVEGYVNLVRRQIPLLSRRVHKSAELVCPSAHDLGLAELLRKVAAGEPLKPHQSRFLKKPRFNDGLFTDWGIQHFHLGTRVESDGFITRSGPVLFALAKGQDFYAIQIYEHGAWEKLEVVELLKTNWPTVTEPYELKLIKPITPPTSEENIKGFRKAGIMQLAQAGGRFIYSMGGGVVSSGDSARVVEDMSNLRGNCQQLEDHVLKLLQSEASLSDVKVENLQLERSGAKLIVRDRVSNIEVESCNWLINADLQ